MSNVKYLRNIAGLAKATVRRAKNTIALGNILSIDANPVNWLHFMLISLNISLNDNLS